MEEVALHEILDDAVELGALVAKSGLTNSQSPEVLGGLRDGLSFEHKVRSHEDVQVSKMAHVHHQRAQ
jgi:hypothetical protein